jgi:S-adenosylmethionine:tRNA ribosyltransferase-isomerase
MEVVLFDYELPPELVAKEPAPERDSSRLLVLDRKTGAVQHRIFKDIAGLLGKGDLLVLNDTKVFPARVHGYRRTGATAEVLFLRQREDKTWEALIGTRGHPQVKETFVLLGGRLRVTVLEKTVTGTYFLKADPEDVPGLLEQYGEVPLPPYIDRKKPDAEQREFDIKRYQTVYARNIGSAAAPTAGFHFTEKTLSDLTAHGVAIAYLTLHISYETFRPVKETTVEEHRMYSEFYRVPPETLSAISTARSSGGRVIAVGTTSCRVLETLARGAPPEGSTDIFIYPPFQFLSTDALITNFHLPKSTLLMLVCAFAGRELILKTYQEAIQQRYRFYSYGDAMFIT